MESLPPAKRLAVFMSRLYERGLTTASGGNLSVRDADGTVWITPSGMDKGALRSDDICHVAPDGTVTSRRKPSVELPFHLSVYRCRPDVCAVLHAHPPHLTAFSAVRRLPEQNLLASLAGRCGTVASVPFAVPGSAALGALIAERFAHGADAVMMENHGICVAASNMSKAYTRLEALEFCATLEWRAGKLGTPRTLSGCELLPVKEAPEIHIDEFDAGERDAEEENARCELTAFIRRCYRKGYFTGGQEACSLRLSEDTFLISPRDMDSAGVEEDDLVLVKNGLRERGKAPSPTVKLHHLLYRTQGEINSLFEANPPCAMAFAVTGTSLDACALSESYMQLRRVQRLTYAGFSREPERIAAMLGLKNPVLICENSRLWTAGASLLQAYDRLEVTEATAHALLTARDLGEVFSLSAQETAAIDEIF